MLPLNGVYGREVCGFALEKAWGCGLRALGRGSRPLRFAGVFVGAISAGVGTVLCFSLRGGPATTDPGARIIGGLLTAGSY